MLVTVHLPHLPKSREESTSGRSLLLKGCCHCSSFDFVFANTEATLTDELIPSVRIVDVLLPCKRVCNSTINDHRYVSGDASHVLTLRSGYTPCSAYLKVSSRKKAIFLTCLQRRRRMPSRPTVLHIRVQLPVFLWPSSMSLSKQGARMKPLTDEGAQMSSSGPLETVEQNQTEAP